MQVLVATKSGLEEFGGWAHFPELRELHVGWCPMKKPLCTFCDVCVCLCVAV